MTAFWILAVVGLVALAAGVLLDGALDLGSLMPDTGGWFSLPALGGFAAVLGFTGILATSLGAPTAVAALLGLLAGAVAAWGVVRLTRLLRDDDDGTTSREQLVGATAVVVSDVPADGYGEVSVVLAGTQSKFTARSEGSVITRGTEVLVLSVLSDTAVLVREM